MIHMDRDIPSFEEGLERLEAVVQKLEGGSLGLEDALNCYEEGIKLSSALQQQLESAQRRVEVLRRGPGGEYMAAPLDAEQG